MEEFENGSDNDDEKYKTPLELVEVQYNDHDEFDKFLPVLGDSNSQYSVHFTRGYSDCKRKYGKTYRINKKGPYTCEECGKVIRFRQKFDQHMLRDHGIARPYSCPTCGQQFKEHRSMEKHTALHEMELTASENFEVIHHTLGTNYTRDEMSSGSWSALSHCKMCAKPVVLMEGGNPFRELCQVCKQKILQSQLYQSKKFQSSEVDFYKCETCSLEFKDKDSLKTHCLEHTSTEKFIKVCEICSKTFVSSRLKARHIRSEHINPERKGCQACEAGCVCKKVAANKTKEIRGKSKIQAMPRKMSYAFELKTKSEEKPQMKHLPSQHPKIFHCMYCKFRHDDREKLNQHINEKHISNRIIHCDECSHTFFRESSLKNHKRFHSGECSYLCPICGLSFITQGNVFSHLRIHPNSTKSLVEL
ncbi:zinc finger protein 639-like [Tachypleus tridentatus]|uniref:zinc finger protein 639-like n=1 Tax=Tachypleus tridentatus TaxID=6853 RepID=UPI003FCF3CFC